MILLTDIPALRSAIIAFYGAHGAALPGSTRGHIEAAAGVPSPVEQFTVTAEALYATLDDVTAGAARDAAAMMTGQLAWFVGATFGTMSLDDRGLRIYAAMRRRVGETTGPDPADDPAPLAEFVPPAA